MEVEDESERSSRSLLHLEGSGQYMYRHRKSCGSSCVRACSNYLFSTGPVPGTGTGSEVDQAYLDALAAMKMVSAASQFVAVSLSVKAASKRRNKCGMCGELKKGHGCLQARLPRQHMLQSTRVHECCVWRFTGRWGVARAAGSRVAVQLLPATDATRFVCPCVPD